MKLSTRLLNLLSVVLTPTRLRRWLLVVFVGVISLASYWALELIRAQGDQSTKTVRTRPDYFVENFNFVNMLPNGQGKYRIVGNQLVHYPLDDHLDVSLPVITSLDPNQPAMTARAERATIKHLANRSENEVHLYKKVVLNRPKTSTAEHLRLNTDYLLLYPDKHTLETDFPIEIILGNTITTGVGLKGNNLTEKIEILNNVHSVMPPRSGNAAQNNSIKK